MNPKHEVVITGYAAVQPEAYRRDSLTPELHCDATPLNRKLARFACRAAAAGVVSAEQALHKAGLTPQSLASNVGLYTNQSGLQHADLDDFANAFTDMPADSDDYQWLWQSKAVSPFLVIKSLSNNLLGLLSMHWQLKGDCAAFVRDEQGAQAALDEALFNIEHGYVEQALVVSAGTEADYIDRPDAMTGKDDSSECGAVALLLESKAQVMSQDRPFYAQLGVGNSESDSVAFSLDRKQRWGGVIFSIAQALSKLEKTPSGDYWVANHLNSTAGCPLVNPNAYHVKGSHYCE